MIHLYMKRGEATRTIDKLMTIVSVIHPLTALPQVVQIYQTQDVRGVSLATWLGFMIIGIIFLAYAVIHKIKPLIVNQLLWFAIDFAIVIGIGMYR